MNEHLDPDVREVADHIRALARAAPPNPRHRDELRGALLRRHRALAMERADRRSRSWFPFRSPRRLAFVGLPTAALAVALSSVIWSLQIAGQPGTQAAEAARISKAIARTVHSVTGWQVILRREGNDASQTIICTMADKHLYIRGTRAYLLQNGAWAELPASSAGLIQNNCNFNIQWAFAVLPSHLAKGQFSVISSRSSRQTEGFRYRVVGSGGLSAEVTAWVDRHTGLVQHLDQVVMRSGRVVERDTAQYSYTR